MVEKISNIGQLLMQVSHASQAASGGGQSAKSDRFSICEYESLKKKNAGDIETPDNVDKGKQKQPDRGSFYNGNADDKRVTHERDRKIKSGYDGKKEAAISKKPEDKTENEQPQDDNAIGGSDQAADDMFLNGVSDEGQTVEAVALENSEKLNSVTGHAVKSEQIKSLHETENGQLGIKTILPEKSTGENGLKQDLSQIAKTQANDVLSDKPAPAKDFGQPASDNGKQTISEVINNKADKNDIPSKSNNANIDDTVSEQKNSQTEPVNNDKNEKSEIQNNQTKSVTQTQEILKSDTQESSAPQQKQNREKTEFNSGLTEATPGGKELSYKSADNSGDAAKNKPEIADVVIHDVKIKEKNESVNDYNKTDIEQILTNADTNQSGKTSVAAAAKTAPDIARDNSQADISAQINRQITESIHSSMMRQGSDRQITVRLNPPELGSVVVKFSEQGNQLTGVLEVSKSETRIEIEHVLPQIMRTLSDSGIQVRKIDVVSSDTTHTNNDSMNEHLPWNDNSDHPSQYESSNQHAGTSDFRNSGFQQWLSNTIEYNRGYRHEPAFASSGSINMLA